MSKRLKIIIISLFILLGVGNLFFGYSYLAIKRNLNQTVQKQQLNKQILDFTQLFLEKVLRSGEVVSFDDRLQLENAVRALNDKEIFTTWEKFTNAKSQSEVQQDFYDLFELLLGRIENNE